MADQRAERVHETGSGNAQGGERRGEQENDPERSEECEAEARGTHASFYGVECVMLLRDTM
jgi:hypothetical protein